MLLSQHQRPTLELLQQHPSSKAGGGGDSELVDGV
jgi:hypothetical protein